MTRPLVTCGIPAFNAEATLARAVLSALGQHCPSVEVLVVDDASTDSTPLLLAALAESHPSLRVIARQTNGGVAVVRNQIIRESKGDFIAFFDDDDESSPDRLTVQLERIIEYERRVGSNTLVVCHTARSVVYPNGRAWIQLPMGGEGMAEVAPNGPPLAKHLLLGEGLENGRGAVPTCSQMARRITYSSLMGFDESLRRCEDTEFAVRAARAGAHFVGVPLPLVIQHMTPTSEKRLSNECQQMLQILNKHRSLLNNGRIYYYARHFILSKYAFMAGDYISFSRHAAAAAVLRPMATLRRLFRALRNLGLNRRMGRFFSSAEAAS